MSRIATTNPQVATQQNSKFQNDQPNERSNHGSVVRTAKGSGLEQAVEKILSGLLFAEEQDKDSDSISIDSDVTVTDQEILQSMQSKTKRVLEQTSSRLSKWKGKPVVMSISESIYEDASPVISLMTDETVSKKISSKYHNVLSGIDENKKIWSEKSKVNTGEGTDLIYNSLEGAVADIFSGIVSSESALSFQSTDSHVQPRENVLQHSPSIYEAPLQESQVEGLNGIIVERGSANVDLSPNSEVSNSGLQSKFPNASLYLQKKNEARRPVSQKIPSDSERLESEDVIHRKNQVARRDSAGEAPTTFQDPSLDKYKGGYDFSGRKNSNLAEGGVNASSLQPMLYLPYNELENMIVKVLGNIMHGENSPKFLHSENRDTPSGSVAKDNQQFLSNTYSSKSILGRTKPIPQSIAIQNKLNYQPDVVGSSDGNIQEKMKRNPSVGTMSNPLLDQDAFNRNLSDNNIVSDLNTYPGQQSRNMPRTGYTIKENLSNRSHPVKISSLTSSKRDEQLPGETKQSWKHLPSKVNVSNTTDQSNLTTPASKLYTSTTEGNLSTAMVSRKVQTYASDGSLSSVLKHISSTSYTGAKQFVRKRSVSTAMEDSTSQSDNQISPSWYRGLVHETSPFIFETEISEMKLSVDAASNQDKADDEKIIDNLLVRVKVNCPTVPVRIAAADISPCLSSVYATPTTAYSSAIEQNLYPSNEENSDSLNETMHDLTPEDSYLFNEKSFPTDNLHSSKEEHSAPLTETMPDLTPENLHLSQEKGFDVSAADPSDETVKEDDPSYELTSSSPPQTDHNPHVHRSTSSISQEDPVLSVEQLDVNEPELSNQSVHVISPESDVNDAHEEKNEENL